MRVPITKCPTTTCPSAEVEAVTIEPVEQPDPRLRQYSYDGYCPVCLVQLFGFFFIHTEEATAAEKGS